MNFCPSHDSLELSLRQLQHLEYQVKTPLTFNAQLQGGTFTMPSARMAPSGTVALGYSHLPPYRLYALNLQLLDWLELTGNYWLYNGILEPVFGHLGFGDDAERAANLKLALHPNLALGCNDFIGTMRMHSTYAVFTHTWQNFEASLGWGQGRINGPFGALSWSPLSSLTLIAEYDGNNYASHHAEHPQGRTVQTPLNVGFQLHTPHLSASLATLRGTTWTASAALHYNLGNSPDLFPKAPPAHPPSLDREPLGLARSRTEFAHELAYALQDSGFILRSLALIPDSPDSLRLTLHNATYRSETEARERLSRILSALSPDNIDSITAVFETHNLPSHEYKFRTADLARYRNAQIGAPEFAALTPMRDAKPLLQQSATLYLRPPPRFSFAIHPRMGTYMGSRTGKFKYSAALAGGPEGTLFQLYYRILASYIFHSTAHDVSAQDRYSPSLLPQVRTDAILYRQTASLQLEEAFVQHAHNFGRGWFGRLAAGYFELPFGGLAAELLYRPLECNWKLGFEIATLWKRRYSGLGFTTTTRQFNGAEILLVPFKGIQYFVDLSTLLYSLDVKLSLGQFLAGDRGVRVDVHRLFQNGFKIGFWTTLTDGHDTLGNRPYYDKGISFELPLDFFLPTQSRNKVGTAMAAWLRDVGARSATGKPLSDSM